MGKCSTDCVVPVHPRLAGAFRQVIDFGNAWQGPRANDYQVHGVAVDQRGPESGSGDWNDSFWEMGRGA